MSDVQAPEAKPKSRPKAPPGPARHRWLDQWMVPTGDALLQVAAGMVDHLEGMEFSAKARKRRRRGADQAAFGTIVSAVRGPLELSLGSGAFVRPQNSASSMSSSPPSGR